MFLRINRLQVELPKPKEADPNAGAAVQELLGGRFGEMSTLMNYMYQSFNFRERKKLKPYYDLISNIATEEIGHIELVAHTINLCVTGSTKDEGDARLKIAKDLRNTHHFIATGQTATVANSMQQPWSGDYVFNSGNLVLDLLHNFFLECGARTQKMRVYEMTDHPTAREMIGYLLVRGGTHALAYAKALEILTGVYIPDMIPIPSLDNSHFDHARKYMEQGLHNVLFTWSSKDYRDIDKIWKGTNPETGERLCVVVGRPEGAPMPDLESLPEEFAPGLTKDHYLQVLKRLKASM